jgi:DNA invertase Pin-like site-specific DNA recombinase
MAAKAPDVEWNEDEMLSSQDEVVKAIEELIAAIAMARAEMRRSERSLRGALQSVAQGESIESMIVLKPPARKRQAFLDALEEVHRTRHMVRQKVFTHALGAGLSISEMARAWGISRQLASRYVKEGVARGDSPPAAVPTFDTADTSAKVLDLRGPRNA